MMVCDRPRTSRRHIELYFYDELSPADRRAGRTSTCPAASECRSALEELARDSRRRSPSRPDVSAPPRPATGRRSCRGSTGDRWRTNDPQRVTVVAATRPSRRPYVGYLAMAALLALVTMSVLSSCAREALRVPDCDSVADGRSRSSAAERRRRPAQDGTAFAAMSEEHFERSKLVVLGLATKDAGRR